MKKVTWKKLVSEMTKANTDGVAKYAAVIFDPVKSDWRTSARFLNDDGEFEEREVTYNYEDCIYTFSCYNKYFNATMFGTSLYADGLTGYDANGIKLSDYLHLWKKTGCYIFDSADELRAFRKDPRNSVMYNDYVSEAV